MKKAMLFKLSLLFASALCLLHSYAQDSPQWGLPEGAKARLGKGSISKIQYSPDGTRLAVASSIGIWLYDTVSNQEASLFAGHTSVVSVAFSPDGGTIAGGYEDASILLWDANTGEQLQTLKGHTHAIDSVAFSPDGGTIASGSGDHTIRLWDTDTGKHLQTFTGHVGRVYSVAFSDGSRLASGGWDHTIRLWDLDKGKHRRTLNGHRNHVFSVAYSPDGGTLASGSWDDTIRLWNGGW